MNKVEKLIYLRKNQNYSIIFYLKNDGARVVDRSVE